MRNEKCPICGKDTAQAQVVMDTFPPTSVWLCEAHTAEYWRRRLFQTVTLDTLKKATADGRDAALEKMGLEVGEAT